MSIFSCKMCNFKTNLRHNFDRHLETSKHIKNLLKLTLENDSTKKILICEPILNPKEPKMNPKEPKMNPKEPKMNPYSGKKLYFCRYCNKEFYTNSHMNRHMNKNCKVKKEQELKDQCEDKNKIAKLENQISKLIDKVGNKTYHTHIGNTTKTENLLNMDNCVSNTNLNIFGKENLEMVTDDIKKELIKGPFKMMPKLLEMIYFNKEYPENHTMKLVNKNKEIMKVHKKDGWKLVDKMDTIDYILEDKNYEVDNYYDTNTDEFSQFVKKTYKNFRRLFDNRDKELWKQIQRDVDLLLWNNM